MHTVEQINNPLQAELLTKETATNLVQSLSLYRDLHHVHLGPCSSPEAYAGFHGIMNEITAIVQELAPEYLQEPAFENTRAAIEHANDFALGRLAEDSGRFRLRVNKNTGLWEGNKPVYYEGTYEDLGDWDFEISLGVKEIEEIDEEGEQLVESIQYLVPNTLGREVDFVLAAAHELAHAIHSPSHLHRSLSANPQWSLSDVLSRAVATEAERFATGIEAIVGSRYIARIYGGDEDKIAEQIRFACIKSGWRSDIFSEEVTGPGRQYVVEAGNTGYSFPLTKHQISERLKDLTIKDPSRRLMNWQGKDRSDSSEWLAATKEAQLLVGLDVLKSYMAAKKNRKHTKEA